MTVCAYVDGLNFYEASKNKWWYPYGWCDWKKTIQNYSPAENVILKYFTSEVSPRNRGATERQKLHLRAMEKIAGAEIIKGQIRQRDVLCRRCDELMACPRCNSTSKSTEKQTDVNIAVHLAEDAIDGRFDEAYLVSADLDLIPAVRVALRRNARSQIEVLFPPEGLISPDFNDLERSFPGRLRCRPLDLNRMQRFPEDLPARWGQVLPKHWRKQAGRRPEGLEDKP
jgi:uncharacterized LabA/DUF88 family protein